MILLGGAVRPTPLSAVQGRSLLDLPVEAHRSVLDLWQDQAAGLADTLGRSSLSVRLLLDQAGPLPALRASVAKVDLRIERDSAELRGSGGVLRDACADYAADDWVLVANAAQVLTRPLGRLAQDMAATGGQIVLKAHADGTSGGLMLIRCGCLSGIPAIGYVDMKEQALPLIATRNRVTVCTHAQPAGLSIRTLGGYIAALRWHHRPATELTADVAAAADSSPDPFAEEWQGRFSIVEDGATVHPSAQVHDSVILRGATVSQQAVVVRSVVCPGGLVHRHQVVQDVVVS